MRLPAAAPIRPTADDFAGGALPSGTVNFAVGQTTQLITIPINGDAAIEPDEGFTVTLSNPTGSTLGTATATGTILNDDAAALPTLAIAATDANKAEGNAGSTPFTFTVTRSGSTTGASSVQFAVTGSGANSANTIDFAGGVLPSGTVNFAAGETSQVITVNVNGDTAVEPSEGFTVTLSQPHGRLDHHGHRHRHDPGRRQHRRDHPGHCRNGCQQGRGQRRQHGLHLHGHPQRLDHGRQQRAIRGYRQRGQLGQHHRLRRGRPAQRDGQLRGRRDQPGDHGQRQRRYGGRAQTRVLP